MNITYIERTILAVALSVMAGAVTTAQAPRERPVSQGYEVEVAARQQWVPTGIIVRQGQSLRFEATGEIGLNRDRSLRARAGGVPNRLDRTARMPSVPLGALVGQISANRRAGAPFAIGDRASVTMPGDGELFLGINDSSFADNTGAFAVWIDVPREGRGRGRGGAGNEEYDFDVAAEQQWLPTGLIVRQGQVLQVESSGEVTLNRSGSPRLGPRGNTSVQLDRFARLPSAPSGSLIGRIGPANQRTNRAFLIGDRTDIAMPGEGELFLGVNDSTFGDNGGSFAVRIDAAGEGFARGRGRGNNTDFDNFGRDVQVDGRQPWVATGITVRQGDVVRVRTTGEVRLNLDGSLRARANGVAGQHDPGAPLPDVAVGTLLGRIESGQGFGQRSRAFIIGDQAGVSMPADGELFLGINDGYFDDNGGGFTVTIETR